MRAKLTKISDNENELRTNTVEGELAFTPQVGLPIRLVSKPLTEGTDVRIITTSPVKEIKGNVYQTENSVYKVEILD